MTQPRGNAAAAEAVAERESAELGDTLAVLDGKLLAILDLRKTAIRRLGEDAEPVDPPPAWQNIALAVGAIALSAATAGVATAVSGAIATAALGTIAAARAAVITEMIKVGTEETITTALGALYAQLPVATNPTDQFFRAQEDAIGEKGAEAQASLSTSVRARVRQTEDPVGVAQALVAAFEAGRKVAHARQRDATLASWCNFLARTELGQVAGPEGSAGVDLGGQVGDTSGKGVLGVRVSAPAGADRAEIEGAEIEGLNETLRGELAARSIGELGISVVVEGDGLHLGENEAGSRWNKSSDTGKRWLANRAAGEAIPDEDWEALRGPDRVFLTDDGARQTLEDDIKSRSLAQLGVELDG